MKTKPTLYKGDFVVIGLVLALAIGLFVALLPEAADDTTLEIYLDGTLIHEMALTADCYALIEIDELCCNQIEVVGQTVTVIEADCYDQICVQTGSINKVGEVIVCMPNKLLIKITGNSNDNQIDAVVG